MYEQQVELVAVLLERTVLDQNQQSTGVLGAVAEFLDGVVDVAMMSNQSIPVEVVEGVVGSLSSLQQWQPHLLNVTTSTARFPLFALSCTMYIVATLHMHRITGACTL